MGLPWCGPKYRTAAPLQRAKRTFRGGHVRDHVRSLSAAVTVNWLLASSRGGEDVAVLYTYGCLRTRGGRGNGRWGVSTTVPRGSDRVRCNCTILGGKKHADCLRRWSLAASNIWALDHKMQGLSTKQLNQPIVLISFLFFLYGKLNFSISIYQFLNFLYF